MTQTQLAEASGVSKVALSKLENAHRQPRWDTSRRVSKALQIDAARLFPDEGEPTPADVLAEHLGID